AKMGLFGKNSQIHTQLLRMWGIRRRAPARRDASVVVRPEIGPEEAGDALAGRDEHLIEGELDPLAGVGLLGAELEQGHDGPEPEAMADVEVHELLETAAGVR